MSTNWASSPYGVYSMRSGGSKARVAKKKKAIKKRSLKKSIKIDAQAVRASRVELLGKDFEKKAFETKPKTRATKSAAPQKSTVSPDRLFLRSARYKQLRDDSIIEVKTSFGIVFVTKNDNPTENNVGYLHVKIPGEAHPVAIPLNAEDAIDIKDGFIALGKAARKFI